MKTIQLFRPVSFMLLFISLAPAAFSQTPASENEVRAVIQKAEDAYNAHDYAFTGQYDIYAPDAILINPVGMYWKNRAEIIKGAQALGAIRLKYETARYTIKDLHFIAPTVARVVVHSIGQVEQDYNFPDGTKGGSKGDKTEGMYLFTLAKRDNGWKITSMQITHIDPYAAALNPVKGN